ncbi:MAG: DUF4147 domain-containing protein [Bacteroidota bacterium]
MKRRYSIGIGKAVPFFIGTVMNEATSMDSFFIGPEAMDFSQGSVFKGSHPLPTKESVASSYELLAFAESIPAGSSVDFYLSGGASAMFCIPAEGIEIDELAETYDLLLSSGASIHQMNVVRKHLDEVKGGRFAQHLQHVELNTYIISDVPGDDPEVIGSGPTIHDSSTFEEAKEILYSYDLWNKLPERVRNHISLGVQGRVPETPKPGIDEHPEHTIHLLNTASMLAHDIAQDLAQSGYNTWVADQAYNESVNQVAKHICAHALSVLKNEGPVEVPAALLFYGESTVKVLGNGKGGRNQHLALACALAIEGQHSITIQSIATDGVDGNTPAAGAVVDSFTTLKARKAGILPEQYLQDFNSYEFHKQMNTLVETGPTGNNLMDLQVVLVH